MKKLPPKTPRDLDEPAPMFSGPIQVHLPRSSTALPEQRQGIRKDPPGGLCRWEEREPDTYFSPGGIRYRLFHEVSFRLWPAPVERRGRRAAPELSDNAKCAPSIHGIPIASSVAEEISHAESHGERDTIAWRVLYDGGDSFSWLAFLPEGKNVPVADGKLPAWVSWDPRKNGGSLLALEDGSAITPISDVYEMRDRVEMKLCDDHMFYFNVPGFTRILSERDTIRAREPPPAVAWRTLYNVTIQLIFVERIPHGIPGFGSRKNT